MLTPKTDSVLTSVAILNIDIDAYVWNTKNGINTIKSQMTQSSVILPHNHFFFWR